MTKITAANNHVMANVKRAYNAKIYRIFGKLANQRGIDAALDFLLRNYVRPEYRDSVRAELTKEPSETQKRLDKLAKILSGKTGGAE